MQQEQPEEQYELFKAFLSTAPVNWNPNESVRRFAIPRGESVSCILWKELFHITGTDIVRSLAYRFECLGRTVTLQKKFEEGIFSDLRNLKPLADSTLEESRSPFLKFLYENQCIRTQKKQKVFYWYSVKHDKLFLDALERDLKREALNQTPCTTSSIIMPMEQAMESAKSHCLNAPVPGNIHTHLLHQKKFAQNPISRVNSPYNDQLLTLQSPPLHHPLPRSFSPAHHFNILHPGSPPQGLVTPPILHQTIMDEYRTSNSNSPLQQMDDYRLARVDSPLQAHTFLAHLNSPHISSPQLGSPHLQYMDPNMNYSGNMTGNMGISPIYEGMQPQIDLHQHFYPQVELGRVSPFQIQDGRSSPYPQPRRHSSLNEKVLDCPQQGCNRQFKRQEHMRRHYRSHQEDGSIKMSSPEFLQEYQESLSRSDSRMSMQSQAHSHPDSSYQDVAEIQYEEEYNAENLMGDLLSLEPTQEVSSFQVQSSYA